jgi:two-component system sensor histidine kinase NreB
VIADTLIRVFDQTADGVLVTDRDGIIEYVNPAYEALTGFTRDDAVGQTPSLVRSGVQTPHFYTTLWNTIGSGRPFQATLTNRARNGRLFQYEQTITPILDEGGEITHYAAIGRDVTERQRGESARMLSQLEQEATRIAGLLHDEAGQYLALAHMALADMSRGFSAADAARVLEVRGYLDHVEHRLREISRGIQPRVVSDLGLEDAIKFIASGCERRNGITVTVDSRLDIRCPASIESLVYVLVRDALNNVSQHARATHVEVLLTREVRGRRAQDSTLSCIVRDDGVGFDGAGMAERTGGSLKSLQHRFASIGGTLTVLSAPGKGTEVRATIPVEV